MNKDQQLLNTSVFIRLPSQLCFCFGCFLAFTKFSKSLITEYRGMRTMQEKLLLWVILFIPSLRKCSSITFAFLIPKSIPLPLIESVFFYRRSYVDYLKGFFEGELQATQSIFSTKDKYEKILAMISDEGMESDDDVFYCTLHVVLVTLFW